MPAAKQKKPKSDIEIARKAKMRPIQEIADKLGIASEHIWPCRAD